VPATGKKFTASSARQQSVTEHLQTLTLKMRIFGQRRCDVLVMLIGTVIQVPSVCFIIRPNIIIRPDRSTTYVDAAYCYRPSNMVCRSVGLSVKLVSPAKTAEPIEMPFPLRTRVDPARPGNNLLDGGPDPPWQWSILRSVPL